METIVITGGTKGIGSDIARKFLKEGWQVMIAARNKSGLATENHDNLMFQQIDVRKEKELFALARKTLEWTGTLACFINCAGYSEWSPLESVNEDFWDKMIDTNLKGSFWGCKVAATNLSEGGSIINVSSLAGPCLKQRATGLLSL